MISIKELNDLCRDHLNDAEVLIDAKRYGGAYYLCGYVIKLALKKRICKTLNWSGFPYTSKEFQNFTHSRHMT